MCLIALQGPAHVALFAPGGAVAASASSSERHIALWSTATAATQLQGEGEVLANGDSPSAKKLNPKVKGLQPALASVSLDQPVRSLDVCSAGEQATSNGVGRAHSSPAFHMAAVSEAGEAYVWLCTPGQGEAVSSQQGAALTCAQLARVAVTKG